jgi:peptidyl-prolyl cis-trans isomerase C
MRYLIASSLILSLCSSTAVRAAETNAPAATPVEIVAHVNDTDITRAQLDKAVKELGGGSMQGGDSMDPAQRGEMEKSVLDRLISERLMIQKSASVTVEGLDEKVQKQIDGIKGRFADEKAFVEAVQSRGMDVATLKEKITESLRIEALIDRDVRSQIKVGDVEVKEFYDKHPEYFSQPAMIRASHILVKVPADADETAKTALKAKIDAARERVVKGEDFAKVAGEVSECPSRAQGGDLNFFGPGQMVKPFEEAAFALKSNEVSQVVTTTFGYHIIKQTGSKPAEVTPLEKEKEKIIEYLTQQKMQDAVMAYVKKLRTDGKVEVLLK